MLIPSFTYFKSPPPFKVWRSHPREQSQILITAGIDGDEYVGIKAAQLLIKNYTQTPPLIPLTIIPLVNITGNRAKVSHNPLDGRFPKSIYPGSPFGTSSSRLMHKLSRYTQGIKLWIDLHGGAHNERLPTPFVWADQTNTPIVDKLTSHLLSSFKTITLYSHHTLTPAIPLAQRGISYLVLESGELGQVSQSHLKFHLDSVRSLLSFFYHFSHQSSVSFIPTYTSLHYHKQAPPRNLPRNLLWSSPTYFVTGS